MCTARKSLKQESKRTMVSFFSLLFILILSCMKSANCFSHPSSKSQNTVQLNHSEMVRTIETFMAFNVTQHLQESSAALSSPYGIPVYHIDIFLKSDYANYHSLILSRLAQDAKRVEWWESRLKLTAFDLPYFFETGHYVAVVDIGTPPQRAHLLVDTASQIPWWDCKPCENCPVDIKIYDPSLSSSYREVDCKKNECPIDPLYFWGCSVVDPFKCRFDVSYYDGTEAEGIMACEKISTAEETIIESLQFGCAVKAPASFKHKNYTGILGFDRGINSFISQTKTTSFSFCPRRYTSSLASGQFLNSTQTPLIHTVQVPLKQDIRPRSYTVELKGMNIASEFLDFESSYRKRGAIIDTGTFLTRFPSKFYYKFRDAFVRNVDLEILPGFIYPLDTCYNLSSNLDDQLPHFPQVQYVMAAGVGYKNLTLEAEHLLLPLEVDGTYCMAFKPIEQHDYALKGAWQLQGTRVYMDIANQFVQFDPRDCWYEDY